MANLNSKRRRSYVVQLWPKQEGKCYFCERPLVEPQSFGPGKQKIPLDYPTLDHLYPTCHGGKNSLDNLVIACFSCNHRKGNGIIPEEILSNREKLKHLFKSGQIKFHLQGAISGP